MRITVNKVEAMIREKWGPEVEFVRAAEYFYFIDNREGRFDTYSVYTMQLNLTPAWGTAMDYWMDTAADFFDREIE